MPKETYEEICELADAQTCPSDPEVLASAERILLGLYARAEDDAAYLAVDLAVALHAEINFIRPWRREKVSGR